MNPSTRELRGPSIRRRAAAGATLAMLLLQGCANGLVSDAITAVTPYKVEIVQGNVVTREQVALLKPGMTRDQVRDILGAPLVTDVFHADRWDYPFTIRRKGAEVQRRSVVIGFSGNTVKSIEAPELPSEREFVAGFGVGKPRQVPKLGLTDEERAALPNAKGAATVASTATASTAPAGPKRDYPPLESAR